LTRARYGDKGWGPQGSVEPVATRCSRREQIAHPFKAIEPSATQSALHRCGEMDRRVWFTRRAPHPGPEEAKLSHVLASSRHSLADRLAMML
jgi:hypothetical protein